MKASVDCMDYSGLTFENDDLLDRKKLVSRVMSIINSQEILKKESESFVISLNAPWGTGKSFLVNMWKNWLLSAENIDNNYYVTYYNAWEHDDCEHPFSSLAYHISELELCNEDNKFVSDVKEKAKNFLKHCGVAILKDGIQKFIGETTAKIVAEGIDKAVDIKSSDYFDEYEAFLKRKKSFKCELKKLIPENGKLIIFIDELDRCRPNFAIETLEVVKHYFDIKDIVFIFSIDIMQLSYSISTMYGAGMDSMGYLRRFFDFMIKIPQPNIESYLRSQLYKNNTVKIDDDFVYKMIFLFNKLRLSLRDVDKIVNSFIVFLMYYKDEFRDLPEYHESLEIYLFFIILKNKFPTQYELILNGRYTLDKKIFFDDIVLENKFQIEGVILRLLKDIASDNAKIYGDKIIKDYKLFAHSDTEASFATYIEKTIEMID